MHLQRINASSISNIRERASQRLFLLQSQLVQWTYATKSQSNNFRKQSVHMASSSSTTRSSESINSIIQSLDNVQNGRDLSTAAPGKIAPGRFFRAANPAHSSLNDTLQLRKHLNINTYLDFRSSEEHDEDPGWDTLLSNGIIKSYDTHGNLTTTEFEISSDLDLPPAQLYRIPLLERRKFITSILWRLSWRKSAQLMYYKLMNDEENIRAIVIPEINAGGLPLVYQILMESAPQEIARALNIILDAATNKKPQLIFCKLGKDRTGLMAALVLACCHATNEEIIADYIKSDGIDGVALGGIEKIKDVQGVDAKIFSSATRESMIKTLDYAQSKYGGLRGYMVKIGFDEMMQQRLKKALSPETKW